MKSDQTTMDINLILAENAGTIKSMAYKALSKIRKPSTYEIDDLIQEGNIACMKAIESWDASKGSKMETWIHFILQNHFYDLVWYSYRKIEADAIEDFDIYQNNEPSSEDSIDFQDWMQHKLSYLERRYIKLCLLEKEIDSEDFRIRVRKKLGLTEKVEDFLRCSIREAVQKSKGE